MMIKNILCITLYCRQLKLCSQFVNVRKFSSQLNTKLNTQLNTQPKTKFQYISDIHVDSRFCAITIPNIKKKCETLLIAGDVGNPFHENFYIFMKKMANKFSKVIFVAGNHEYDSGCLFDKYKYDIHKEQLNKIFKQLPNVFFLDNDIHTIDSNIIIAGTTLWSNPMLHNQTNSKHFNNKHNLTIDKYETHIKKHFECVNFIKQTCKEFNDKQIIMLSHYVPTFKLIENKYLVKGQPNGWFATDLEHLIKKPIDAWICGHSHSVITKRINKVYCGLNAHGYNKENKSNMITNMMFSL